MDKNNESENDVTPFPEGAVVQSSSGEEKGGLESLPNIEDPNQDLVDDTMKKFGVDESEARGLVNRTGQIAAAVVNLEEETVKKLMSRILPHELYLEMSAGKTRAITEVQKFVANLKITRNTLPLKPIEGKPGSFMLRTEVKMGKKQEVVQVGEMQIDLQFKDREDKENKE